MRRSNGVSVIVVKGGGGEIWRVRKKSVSADSIEALDIVSAERPSMLVGICFGGLLVHVASTCSEPKGGHGGERDHN